MCLLVMLNIFLFSLRDRIHTETFSRKKNTEGKTPRHTTRSLTGLLKIGPGRCEGLFHPHVPIPLTTLETTFLGIKFYVGKKIFIHSGGLQFVKGVWEEKNVFHRKKKME